MDESVSPKRFRQCPDALSILPNELLIKICRYLSDVDVVYAFWELNAYFRHFALHYCDTFDFKSVSKAKFAYVIRAHNTRPWKSLRLSNDDQTPGQIEFFWEKCSTEVHFRQLETLSLISMKPCYTKELSPKCSTLTQLVSLTLGRICGYQMVLLELPLLRNLVVTSCRYNRWIENLHQLKSLEYIVVHECYHENHLRWPTNLERLRICYTETTDSDNIPATLTHLPQLCSLEIYYNSGSLSIPNGNKWERLIRFSCPLLTNFQFYFKFLIDSVSPNDLIRLMSTFSTPFYLHEKQWAVQCKADPQRLSTALLYSLPFAFAQFEILQHSVEQRITTTSTCQINNKRLYGNVKELIVSDNPDLNLLNGNIQHLVLICSGSPAHWLFSMMHIRQLSLSNQINMSAEDFSRLINATPCLDSLNASSTTLAGLTSNWQNKPTCDQLASKVRSLNLCFDQYLSPPAQKYLNAEEILPIVHTFGDNCQHLTLAMCSKDIVTDTILKTMRQLRSLRVYLKEELTSKAVDDWFAELRREPKMRESWITRDDNEYNFWFHC